MSKSEISRRKFLGGTGSLALALPLASLPAAAQIGSVPQNFSGQRSHPALIPYRELPVRQRGETVIMVDPPTDGVSDCAPAIQAAIDSLPEDGGTVLVRYHQTQSGDRDCVYMIDTGARVWTGPKKPHYGIMLRSNMLLDFEPGVQLQITPNNFAVSYAVWVNQSHDVEIANMNLIGERFAHTMSGSGTDEWGFGLFVHGCNGITLRSSYIANFEGDGISMAYAGNPPTLPTDIVVWDTVCTGNRRQAVSIVAGNGIYLFDSEFSNTHGTAPADGIDIEVEWIEAPISNITIDNCIIRNNQANAVELNSSGGMSITNVNITNSVLAGNYSGVYAGVRGKGSVLDTATIYGNAIYQNRAAGIYLRGAPTHFTIGGSQSCDPHNNSFANNLVTGSHKYIYPISAQQQAQGYNAGSDMSFSDTALAPGANNVVGWNFFYSPNASITGAQQHPCNMQEPASRQGS